MASVIVLDKTTSSIDLNVQGLSGSPSSYTKVNFYCTNTGVSRTVTSFYGSAGDTYSGRASFTGLSSGTTYTFSVRIYYSGGDTSLGSISVTTVSSDSTPPTIKNLYSNLPSHGWTNSTTVLFGADVRDSNSGVYSVNCNFNGTDKSSYSGTNGEYSFTFNTPTTPGTYEVTWSARDNNNNLNSGVSTNYWIGYDGTAPNITVTDISNTGSSIRAGIEANDTMSGVASITFKISTAGSSSTFGQAKTYYASTIGETMSQYHSFTVDANGNALSLGKTYYVEATAMDRAGNYKKTIMSVVFSYSKPSAWSWTSEELNAFNNRGAFSTLTWQRWNAFCDYVLQLTSWYYNDKTDTYNLAGAKASADDKVLTATKFNLVKNAIGSMNSTGISNVSKGDPVLGSYFITLANKANGVTK